MTYSTLRSDRISFIAFRKVTRSLHFTLQIIHFILIALLPYCTMSYRILKKNSSLTVMQVDNASGSPACLTIFALYSPP